MKAAMSEERKATPKEIETAVLTKAARRCAFCFYLSGDLGEKEGQIAHLDQNPSNFAEDNLLFLCLRHHTLYDSKTSQHKNYTISEAKQERNELYEAIVRREHWSDPSSSQQKARLFLKPNLICREIAVPGRSLSGDERSFMLDVVLENVGIATATDFRLELEIPGEFDDAGPHARRSSSKTPGFQSFSVNHAYHGISLIYPTEKTGVLLEVRLVVRNSRILVAPDLTTQPFTATVYSGDMRPVVTRRTLVELIDANKDEIPK
jgi:hypothetical protein